MGFEARKRGKLRLFFCLNFLPITHLFSVKRAIYRCNS
jgi:hypothetical protein